MFSSPSSTNNTDEHAWAGLWLYMATNDKTYLNEAVKYYQPGPSWGMSWDDKQAANQVRLSEAVAKGF